MMQFETFTLTNWLDWISNQHPAAIDLTLERVSTVAKRVHLLTMNCPVVTVAGTNGKGSCCALSEAILLAHGLQVGVFTSPHLLHYNERVRVNGKAVSDEELIRSFQVIQSYCQDISLTYFEYSTLNALYLFKQCELDIIILEVGLGGRFDAVNIIDPTVAMITSIDFDHQQWLGNTREVIGLEKAGIFRSHQPAVFGDLDLPKTIEDYAQRLDTKLFCQGKDFYFKDKGEVWDWYSDNIEYRELPKPAIHLQNASTVLMALQLLPDLHLNRQSLMDGMQNLHLMGRQQLVAGKPAHLFDVAHNPHATCYLADTIKTLGYSKIYAVASMLADKEIVQSLKPLVPLVDQWYVAGLEVERGASGATMVDSLQQLNCTNYSQYPTIEQAYVASLSHVPEDGLLVIFGSFYTVSKVFSQTGF